VSRSDSTPSKNQADSGQPSPYAVIVGHPSVGGTQRQEEVLNGDAHPPLALEVMTVMAQNASHALRTAAAVSVQRGQPDTVIVGALSRDEVTRILGLLDRSAALWDQSRC
jgi:hypothetical protein